MALNPTTLAVSTILSISETVDDILTIYTFNYKAHTTLYPCVVSPEKIQITKMNLWIYQKNTNIVVVPMKSMYCRMTATFVSKNNVQESPPIHYDTI